MMKIATRFCAAVSALALTNAQVGAVPSSKTPSVAPGGDISTNTVKPTGGAKASSLAAILSRSINLADQRLATDADDTASLGRAVSQALLSATPVEIDLSCGTYNVSAATAVNTSASQGVVIRGASSSCVTLNQTADADGFDVLLGNYGGVFGTGAFQISGIKFTMGSAGSTTRKAVNVATTAASGAAGVPMQFDDLVFASSQATRYWGNGLYLSQIPNTVYIRRISSYYAGQTTGGVAISINGTSGAYTTGVNIRDVSLDGGLKGIELGNYLQGIHIANANTVGTAYALTYAPSAGIGVEIQISDSYLDGKTQITNANGGSIDALKISNTYFDALNGVNAGETLASITGITTLSLSNNTYHGSSSISNITGLSIAGANILPGSINGDSFTGFLNGGTALALSNTVYPIGIVETKFNNNSNNVTETGVANSFVDTHVAASVYSFGNPSKNSMQALSGAAGTSVTYLQCVGPDTNCQVVVRAKGLPGSDVNLQDGSGRAIFVAADSQSGTSSIGATIVAGTTTTSNQLYPGAGGNLLIGGPSRSSGSVATTATTGFMQIPYMAGAPTGTPATIGGATMVFDTTNNKLWMYSPSASAWKSVTLN